MLTQEDFEIRLSELTSDEEKVDLLNLYSWDIRRSYPQKSLEIAQQALKISESINYDNGLAYSLRSTGTALYLLSRYNNSLSELQKALSIFLSQGNKQAASTTIRNIGNVYHSLDQLGKSLDSYFEALPLAIESNDEQGVAYIYGNIGYVYLKQKDYKNALKYIQKAVIELRKLDDKLGLADALNNLANTFLRIDQKEKVWPAIRESNELSLLINHVRGLANSNSTFGAYFVAKNDFPSAIHHYNKALSFASELGEKQLVYQIYKDLAQAYRGNGDTDLAFDVFEKYDELKTQVLTKDNETAINALKSEYDYAQSQKLNQYYKQKNEELERLSIVASETDNVILILDKNGKLEWVNKSFEVLNAITLEDLKKLKGETIFEVSNNPRIREIFDECANQRKSVTYESLNITTDGKRIWESSTVTPIFDEDGQLKKFIIIDTDVTERKDQEEIIREKNKDITDSINYAKKIQEALLPSLDELKNGFSQSFILYKPKDIVSGDFYWFSKKEDILLIAVADCTGHGVPGAFMSVIANDVFNQVLHDPNVRSTALALQMIDRKVHSLLNHNKTETADGMDVALCAINTKTGYVEFSGANRPVWIFSHDSVTEFKGDKLSVGGKVHQTKIFTSREYFLKDGDSLYLFSDGYADQFGGDEKKKLMTKNFRNLLTTLQHLPLAEQKAELEDFLKQWQGELEQVDDILVMGVKR